MTSPQQEQTPKGMAGVVPQYMVESYAIPGDSEGPVQYVKGS